MKIVYSWLAEFFEPGALDSFTVEQIGETLTSLGLVCESIDSIGFDTEGIVVAEIINVRPHPEADRIQLADVDPGPEFNQGQPTIQICCGAPNIAPGQKVPLATLGTTMPGGMEIAKRKMRGEESNGMLCSGEELGIPDDVDGIMILDSDAKVGSDLRTYLGQESDFVFDLDIEGNRPDALSHLGVARDLSAKLGLALKSPEPSVDSGGERTASSVKIDNQIPDLCSRFGVRVLSGIKVGSSPDWMAARLNAAGMRPINSIVDISNYLMLELGQPTHTYDLDLVSGATLGVRMAADGEEVVTLDDEKRTLSVSDMAIIDGEDSVIGIAGVMGGASTEINDNTSRIVVEAAIWDRMTTAKTARRLNLRSEASTRFERGVDPLGVERALERFCELAVEICGAEVSDISVVEDGAGYAPRSVEVRPERVSMFAGQEISTDEIVSLLAGIGFEVASSHSQGSGGSHPDRPKGSHPELDSGSALEVSIPSWRPDASIEEDVVEEALRLYGYENLGKTVPKSPNAGYLTDTQLARRRFRIAARALGFNEAMPMPFLAPGDLAAAELDESGISLVNPLVAEESILRTSMLPGLLKSVRYNQSHRQAAVQLFELGSVTLAESADELPTEVERIAFVWSGFDDSGSAATSIVSALKGFLDSLKMSAELVNAGVKGLHPTRAAEIKFRGQIIGSVGEVSPVVLSNFGVTGRVGYCEFDVASLVPALAKSPKMKAVSKYPSSDIDLAFDVPEDVQASSVLGTLQTAGGPELVQVRLFDIFRKADEPNTRSLAFALRLQAADRTLTDEEVAKIRQKCIDTVEKKCNSKLRG